MKGEASGVLRVGAVPFLNTRPLIRYLDETQPPSLELSLEVPSRLTRMMRQSLLDVALLPSIEYLRAGDYRIIPGISISADGLVESVRIFSKVPVEEIRSLALDESSRTSVALAKILLKRKLGSLPQLTGCRPDADLNKIDADAMLLIGDAAMTFSLRETVFVFDLGEEWKRLTGLPFVYAMWVTRSGIDGSGLQSKLLKARDEGLARLHEIAVDASDDLGLSVEVCLSYLRDIMRYELGERDVEALRLFQELAAEDGLCRGDMDIAFDCR